MALINPTVQFLDLSNTSDINYELPFSSMSENIQSVDAINKQIVFSDIENLSASQHRINRRKMQVYAKFPENLEISKLNETSKVIFTAIYQDSSGNTANISKEIYLNIGWTANLAMDLAQRVTKYVSNNDGSGKSITLETTISAKIVSNGKNNILSLIPMFSSTSYMTSTSMYPSFT